MLSLHEVMVEFFSPVIQGMKVAPQLMRHFDRSFVGLDMIYPRANFLKRSKLPIFYTLYNS